MKSQMQKTHSILTLCLLVAVGAGCAKLTEKPTEAQKPQSPATIPSSTQPIEAGEQRVYVEDVDPMELEDVCGEEWNTDEPNTSVPYTNKTFGFQLQIPYNEAWGNDTYKVRPYHEMVEDGVLSLTYGYARSGETCHLEFWNGMNTSKQRGKEDILKSLSDWELLQPAEAKKVNGLDAVYYELGELCGGWNVEIVGENYNYQFGGCYVERPSIDAAVNSFGLL